MERGTNQSPVNLLVNNKTRRGKSSRGGAGGFVLVSWALKVQYNFCGCSCVAGTCKKTLDRWAECRREVVQFILDF